MQLLKIAHMPCSIVVRYRESNLKGTVAVAVAWPVGPLDPIPLRSTSSCALKCVMAGLLPGDVLWEISLEET